MRKHDKVTNGRSTSTSPTTTKGKKRKYHSSLLTTMMPMTTIVIAAVERVMAVAVISSCLPALWLYCEGEDVEAMAARAVVPPPLGSEMFLDYNSQIS